MSPETARAAGLASLSKHQVEQLLGLDHTPKGGGLGVPYKGSGETVWRIRLDDPPPKGGRWRAPKGEPVRPYLPPAPIVDPEVWHDTNQGLLGVESPIKALASSEAGFPSIGLGGVETGHDPEAWAAGKKVRLHPELLKRVAWKDRDLTVVFDAGRALNPRVALAEARFASALMEAQARVRLAGLPLYQGEDQGPDDFLAREGKEAFLRIIEETIPGDPLEQLRELLKVHGRREGVRRVFGLLEQMPFQASLYLRGPGIDAPAAHETKPDVPRKSYGEMRVKFGSILYTKIASEEGELPPDPYVREMNEKHAVVILGGQARILWEEYDHDFGRLRLEFLRERDLELMYKHRRVYQGKKELSLAAYWLKHPQRRNHPRVFFDPSKGKYEGGYNLWHGFAVSPAPGDWSLMRTHILENICSGNEEHYRYFIGWCADLFQHPAGPRPGTAVVFRGKEGVGKGIVAKNLGLMLGRHFVHVSQSRHLTGNFNSHLADCLLLFGDEAFWAGDKASEGPLKALITEETLQIERKGENIISMQNLVRLLLSSNNEWVVPAGMEARRFAIFDVSDARMQDELYFRRIADQMSQGGREAMLYDLLHFDLSTVDLKKVPQTEALLEQKLHSLTPVQRWWHGRLMAGELTPGRPWKGPHPTKEVHNLYLNEAKEAGDRRRAVETELGRQLKKLCPPLINRKATIVVSRERVWSDEEKRMVTEEKRERVPCFFFPHLDDCRALFAEAMNSPNMDWPAEEEGEANKEEEEGEEPAF